MIYIYNIVNIIKIIIAIKKRLLVLNYNDDINIAMLCLSIASIITKQHLFNIILILKKIIQTLNNVVTIFHNK
jgi:hypothetical protein